MNKVCPVCGSELIQQDDTLKCSDNACMYVVAAKEPIYHEQLTGDETPEIVEIDDQKK